MRALILSSLVFLATAAFAAAEEGRVLTVTGQATAEAPADMAVVSLGVVRTEPTAEAAMTGVSAAVGALLDDLTAAGLAPEDMQTSGFSLRPEYLDRREPGQMPKIDAYTAQNGVTIRVRDLSMLGGLLGDLVAGGANRMQGLSFDVADPAPLMAEARRRAVAEARASAEVLAAAAGLTLEDIVSITEGGGGGGPMPYARGGMMLEAAAMDVPVAEGAISRSATVTIVWTLADAE